MADNAKTNTPTVIPTMRYNDAAAAIAWLCEAFGFETHLVCRDPEGHIWNFGSYDPWASV